MSQKCVKCLEQCPVHSVVKVLLINIVVVVILIITMIHKYAISVLILVTNKNAKL